MLNSKDWVNTIGAVLTRRANDVGDIVKVERGTWGLKEWYPNRSFKKEKEAAKEDEPKGENTAGSTWITDPKSAWTTGPNALTTETAPPSGA